MSTPREQIIAGYARARFEFRTDVDYFLVNEIVSRETWEFAEALTNAIGEVSPDEALMALGRFHRLHPPTPPTNARGATEV